MATSLPSRRTKSIQPDIFEKLLALGSMLMMVAVLVAIIRGSEHWAEMKPLVWLHLATILVALVLTPSLLLQTRGTKQHRTYGWAWSAAMFSTAALSFFIHVSGPGSFSPIHLLSALTVIGVPLIVLAARRHMVTAHRFGIRATVLGALLIAGFFTFPFGRILGRWLLA